MTQNTQPKPIMSLTHAWPASERHWVTSLGTRTNLPFTARKTKNKLLWDSQMAASQKGLAVEVCYLHTFTIFVYYN